MGTALKPFSIVLVSGILLLAVPACHGAAGKYGGIAEYDEETIYYPAGWRHDMKPDKWPGPPAGIDIYFNYIWFDQSRPIGAKNWATIRITRWNCDRCSYGVHAGTLIDFLKDKDCSAPKCAFEQSKCPVHSAHLLPRWRITNKCSLLDRYPKIVGGVCGDRYAKKKHGGTVYYYFNDETEGTAYSDPKEHLEANTVIFEKGAFIYSAELIAPKNELKKYMRDFDSILWNMTVRSDTSGVKK